MSYPTYQDLLDRKVPRAQVQYAKGETVEMDQYAYGVMGGIPAPNLIGFITRVQADIYLKSIPAAPENLLLIFWDNGRFYWFLDEKIPVDAVVGALELMKQYTVNAKFAEMVRPKVGGLIDPKGRPLQ